MNDLTESKLQSAYELIKAGQKDQARKILIPLVRADPHLADGWFLLGHAASQPQEKIRCFRQVLRLEPDNQAARKQLARLLASQPASPKTAPAWFWGLAGVAALFIGLAGLGLWWVSASPAQTIPGSATPSLPEVASTPLPKATPIPGPSARPTITLAPTLTPQPSVTVLPTLTLTFTITSSPVPREQPRLYNFCLAPNDLSPKTAPFKIENYGKDKATVHINGISYNGNHPISCQAIVKQGRPVFLTLSWGNYEYIIIRGTTTRRGSFFINQPYKATMRIFKDKIQIGPFP